MANFLKQSCVLALFSLVISSAANADEFEQVNSLAFEIQSSAGQLLSNTEPFRNATNYTQLVEHCGRLQQGTTELVNLARHETDIYIVEAKVNQLDECFQQLPSLVIGAEFEASQGRGIISGDTTPFKQLLERTDQGIYYLLETVTLIRNRIEQVQAPGQIVAGGEILIPIQPPVLQQQFGHLPHGNGLGIQFNSFGGSFGNQQRLDDQRRQAEQQRRQAEQRRQQADQLRRRLDDQRRQADQQRQQEQQRRQADQQRQRQEQQRRQAARAATTTGRPATTTASRSAATTRAATPPSGSATPTRATETTGRSTATTTRATATSSGSTKAAGKATTTATAASRSAT